MVSVPCAAANIPLRVIGFIQTRLNDHLCHIFNYVDNAGVRLRVRHSLLQETVRMKREHSAIGCTFQSRRNKDVGWNNVNWIATFASSCSRIAAGLR